MMEFNAKSLQNICLNGDKGNILSESTEKGFQEYILNTLTAQNYVNRVTGYTLAIGPWDESIHADWFIKKSNSNNGINWSTGFKEWMLNQKRPDFVFVKNNKPIDNSGDLLNSFSQMSVHNLPNEYVIWEVKKAWFNGYTECDPYCGNCGSCWSSESSYRYCNNLPFVQPHEDYNYDAEFLIDDYNDLDYDDDPNESYDIVQCKELYHLHERARNQASGYAELLKSAISNKNANIFCRSVVCVFTGRRKKMIFEIDFC